MSEEFKITASLEDYLETILFLKRRNGLVRVTDVAIELNISKPSVNKAIKILQSQGLIDHQKYGLLSLTEKGTEAAEKVAHRHKVLKKFLSELIGIDDETAEKEACLIEHAISLETINKLDEFLDKNL